MNQFAPSFRDAALQPAQVALALQRHLGFENALVELTINNERFWDISLWEPAKNPRGFALYYRQTGPHPEEAQFYIEKSGVLADGWLKIDGSRHTATEQDLHAAITMLQADELLLDIKLPKRDAGETA